MTSTDLTGAQPWRLFWERGGWWRAVLLAGCYLALYLGVGRFIVSPLMDRVSPSGDVLAGPAAVLVGVGLATFVGSIILLAFAASLRWLPELFGRQPLRGSAWMWIAPVVVVLAAALRAVGTDYSHLSVGLVVATYGACLFVGLSEELLTRGLAVNLLRRRYSERVVMILSSLIFALLHSSNLLTGQPLPTVLVTVGFTFIFGVAMYLTLRVTGSLIWPILLHGITDPSTVLAVGGIDAGHPTSPLAAIGGSALYAYAIITVVALLAVRGRVGTRNGDAPGPR